MSISIVISIRLMFDQEEEVVGSLCLAVILLFSVKILHLLSRIFEFIFNFFCFRFLYKEL